MKSANPLNAPLIPLRCSRTFCRCVCAKWVPAAASADSFIVLLFRLHLKSITTNGRLFNCNVSAPSSPAANQTHCIMWPAGGGASGFKTGAPAGPGPDTSPDRSQDQYQQQIAEQQTVGTSSSSSLLLFLVSSTGHFLLPCVWTGMQCVRCPAILALAAFVLCSPVSSQLNRDQDQNQDLDLELRHHRMLQRARGVGLLSQVRAS